MQILNINDSNSLELALHSLTRGELVIYPTETCYGIAADATNPDAVTKLLTYKGDRYRQVAVAVSDMAMAQQYVSLNDQALSIYNNFLPGPITVISKSLHKLDRRLESESGNLGIRLPKHDFALALITAFETPLTATSANTSGKKEPYSLSDWQKYTVPSKQKMVALFLDAGKLQERPTSTVVDTTLNDLTVLRQGALIIPSISSTYTSSSDDATIAYAQTLIKSHLNLLSQFPLILALQGDLGVGKTQFVKGVAKALGIDLNISSPTYTLMKEYPYKLAKAAGTLYHIDTWRLSDPNDLETSLHFSRLLQPGNVVAVEWAGKAVDLLKSYEKDVPILVINIKELDEYKRQISHAFSTPEWT